MTEIICPDCGKEQPDTNKFCKNCGANLSNIKSQIPEEKIDIPVKDEDIKIGIEEEPSIGNMNESSSENININESAPEKENIKTCSNCGTPLKNEKFCPHCGQSTESIIPNETKEEKQKTCPSCGHIVKAEKFCPHCGANLQSNQSQSYSQAKKFCNHCGSQIDINAEICPKCGVRQGQIIQKKSSLLALVLSFIFPGIGQIYNGQTKKGIYLIIGYIVSYLLVSLLIGLLLVPVIWIYGMYDAYQSAKAISNGEYLEDKLF